VAGYIFGIFLGNPGSKVTWRYWGSNSCCQGSNPRHLWWVCVKRFWPGSGRVSHLWFGFRKFPLKMSNFSIFSIRMKKYLGQRQVSYYRSKVSFGRVGSGRVKASLPDTQIPSLMRRPHGHSNPTYIWGIWSHFIRSWQIVLFKVHLLLINFKILVY